MSAAALDVPLSAYTKNVPGTESLSQLCRSWSSLFSVSGSHNCNRNTIPLQTSSSNSWARSSSSNSTNSKKSSNNAKQISRSKSYGRRNSMSSQNINGNTISGSYSGTSSSNSDSYSTNRKRKKENSMRTAMVILAMATSPSSCAAAAVATANLIVPGSQFTTLSSICMNHLSTELVPMDLDARFTDCVGKLPPNIEVRFRANAFQSPHYRYLRTISFAGDGYDVFNLVAVPRRGRSLPILGIDIVSLPRTYRHPIVRL